MKVRYCPCCGNPDLLVKYNTGYCFKCDITFKVRLAGEEARKEIVEHYKKKVFK